MLEVQGIVLKPWVPWWFERRWYWLVCRYRMLKVYLYGKTW